MKIEALTRKAVSENIDDDAFSIMTRIAMYKNNTDDD